MNAVTASSPGKVVLSGEYAVLDGAPAVCMAVDRRARVTIERHDEEWHRVIAPGFSAIEGRFVTNKDQFEWLAGGDSYSLLEQVWREINPAPDCNLSYSLDTREFLDAEGGNKIGLGSSAALAAALATSLCAIFAPNIDARQVARAAHRKFQNGVGSGVDIACSLQGGVIEYSMDRQQQSQLDWPDGLAFAVLWSGIPASTAEKLMRAEQTGARKSRADLTRAAEQMAMAWRDGSAQHILDGYRTYTNVLRKFSVDHDLGIFDAGHGALVEAANEMGLIYKPCGAGGGDIGIALATDEATIAAFVASPVAAGFEPLDLAIDPHGTKLFREKH
jgi:phosphomevalonate kinase